MGFHIELFSKHSGMSHERLLLLDRAVRNLNVDGAIVETGVMNGGSLATMANADRDRIAWGFDSWHGCPKPGKYDYQCQHVHEPFEGMCTGSIDRVRDLLFNQCDLLKDNIFLVEGWIEDTLPKAKFEIGQIAFLHIDVDFYEPTIFVLDQLYGQVVSGGWVICDDYNYWAGANRAVHEFIAEVDTEVTLERFSTNGVWWKKT